jgi:hypothetical protein
VQTLGGPLGDSQIERAQGRGVNLPGVRSSATQNFPYAVGVKLRQFIFSRDEGLAASRISLPATTAEQLPVDTSSFVQLRRKDVQTAESSHSVAKCDICAAACHVGRHGYVSHLTGFGDDQSFAEILPGIKQLMGETPLLHQVAQMFGGFDRTRTNKYRASLAVHFFNACDD